MQKGKPSNVKRRVASQRRVEQREGELGNIKRIVEQHEEKSPTS
jgi:hypothetical protein